LEIVLVHGGLHGAWCWEHVLPLLREDGYTASAPDLPGMGQDRTPLPEVSLASTADFLAAYVGSRQDVCWLDTAWPDLSSANVSNGFPDICWGLSR